MDTPTKNALAELKAANESYRAALEDLRVTIQAFEARIAALEAAKESGTTE